MANYVAAARTNYFRVTDEQKWQGLFEGLCAEDIEDFSEVKNGVMYHGFGGYDSIDYFDPDTEEYSFDLFLRKLQKILPEDEAFIYFETGHEKLRCVTGCVIVCTSRDIESMSLSEWALKTAKYMVGSDFETQMDY